MQENVLMTPLHDQYMAAGVEMAPFMGCLLPAHFGDPADEHRAVRTAVGLFDGAHRCEVLISGPEALKSLQNLLCSDIAPLKEGQVTRSLMLNMQGGVMDDVQVYRMGENEYRLALHVCNRDKDLRHIGRQCRGDVQVEEPRAECRLSLDGPRAAAVLEKLTDTLPRHGCFLVTTVANIPCRLSRIGFAGEDGFGLCCPAPDGGTLYSALVEAGRDFGLRLCGMESFVTLRLEAGHSLYGLEIDDAVNPLETGFRHLVRLEKRTFIGRDALVAGGEPRRARIGLRLKEGVVATGCAVVHRDKEVGAVTSGAYCPYTQSSFALALVETPYRDEGRTLRVEVDGRLIEAKVVPLPFYTPEK